MPNLFKTSKNEEGGNSHVTRNTEKICSFGVHVLIRSIYERTVNQSLMYHKMTKDVGDNFLCIKTALSVNLKVAKFTSKQTLQCSPLQVIDN